MEQNMNQPLAGSQSRREFLARATTAAAVVAATNPFKTPVYGQAQAPSPGRVIGANDRIVVGYIGLGGQGFNSHLLPMKANAAALNITQAVVFPAKGKPFGTPAYEGIREAGDDMRYVATLKAMLEGDSSALAKEIRGKFKAHFKNRQPAFRGNPMQGLRVHGLHPGAADKLDFGVNEGKKIKPTSLPWNGDNYLLNIEAL